MYSIYKLNKQGDNIVLMYSFHNLEPVWHLMSYSLFCFLTCIQVLKEAGKVILYFHLFRNFPQFVVIYRVKGFSVLNEAEVDVFSGILLLFLWSLVPLSFLNQAWTSQSSLLKPGLENSEHYFTSTWDEYNYAVVWAFFGIAFLWDWNENWPFPVLWPLPSFPNLLAYWVQYFHSIIF